MGRLTGQTLHGKRFALFEECWNFCSLAALKLELEKIAIMRYSVAQVSYHWITFALILVMAGTGMAYSYDWADGDIMIVHQIAGQFLIVVLVLRLATRLTRRTPAAPTDHAAWEHALANLVQFALYAVLIAYVASGYISASGETDNVLIAPVSLTFARSDTGEAILELHYILKWVLLGLLSLHVAGALKHVVVDKDETMAAMSFHRNKTP